MKTRILLAALVAVFVASIGVPVFAMTIEEIAEGHPTLWVANGTKYDRTEGNYGHAYQYLSATGGNPVSWGRWKVYGYEPAETYYWWVWIPLNYTARDAGVQYTVVGTSSQVITTLDQESKADEWFYLGSLAGDNQSTVWLDNYCVSGLPCASTYEVWWDQMMYQHP